MTHKMTLMNWNWKPEIHYTVIGQEQLTTGSTNQLASSKHIRFAEISEFHMKVTEQNSYAEVIPCKSSQHLIHCPKLKCFKYCLVKTAWLKVHFCWNHTTMQQTDGRTDRLNNSYYRAWQS